VLQCLLQHTLPCLVQFVAVRVAVCVAVCGAVCVAVCYVCMRAHLYTDTDTDTDINAHTLEETVTHRIDFPPCSALKASGQLACARCGVHDGVTDSGGVSRRRAFLRRAGAWQAGSRTAGPTACAAMKFRSLRA